MRYDDVTVEYGWTAAKVKSSESWLITLRQLNTDDGSYSDYRSASSTAAGSVTFYDVQRVHYYMARVSGCDEQSNCASANSDDVWVRPTPTVRFGSSSYSVNEGTSTTIYVRLSHPSGQTLDIPIAVSNGSADDGDYSVSGLPDGEVSFASDETSATFTITANCEQDTVDETVNLGFGALPTGVGQGSPPASTLTINDAVCTTPTPTPTPTATPTPTPTVSFGSSSYSVDEGTTTAITVNLSQSIGQDLDILVTVSNGTAQSGDYSVSGLPDGEVSFAGDETSKTFTITANQDADCDDETVNLRFGTLPTDVGEGSPATSTLTIDDDEDASACSTPPPPPTPVPTPTVSISAVTTSVTEGQSITFTLTASPTPSSALQVKAKVTQTGSFILGTATTSVTIPSGQTSASFSVATHDDNVDEPSGYITARVEAGTGYSVGGSSSVTATVLDNDLPKLTTPTDLDVRPRVDRKAVLSWTGDPRATGYVVEIKKFGGVWADAAMRDETATSLEIVLDRVLIYLQTGLADPPHAYDFRIKATDDSGALQESEYSDAITIIDTPITKADGDSRDAVPASTGQAELEWTPVEDILMSPNYAGGTYTFRYRKFTGTHSAIGWLPMNHERSATSSDPITGLGLEEIYAIQLIYDSSEGRVFSGRDVYVWPSVRVPDGERVASYPLKHPVGGKTYAYRICGNTFPGGNFASPDGRNKKEAWKKLIVHALEQWEVATDGLVTMTHQAGEECADYTPFINRVASEIQTLETFDLDHEDVLEHLQSLLNSLRDSNVLIPALKEIDDTLAEVQDNDLILNDVLMFDEVEGDVKLLLDAAVFREFADELGHEWCWDKPTVSGCARRTGNTADIFIRREPFDDGKSHPDPLSLPGGDEDTDRSDTPFNTCPATGKGAYEILVHEAGHALGIREGTGGDAYQIDHPFFREASYSVMSYKRIGHFCSPHPFDIMAIYALYQTIDVSDEAEK